MMSRQLACLGSLCSAVLVLTGCSSGDNQEIREWMMEVQRNTKVHVEPVSSPKKFSPFVYEANGLVEPFHPDKLEVVYAKGKSASANSGIKAPDMNRRREVLESYPLDTIKMVGTLQNKGHTFAVLQIDGNVHHAKIGNYIGTNFGMVAQIKETEVQIREIVQDASGEWVERDAKLELLEAQQ